MAYASNAYEEATRSMNAFVEVLKKPIFKDSDILFSSMLEMTALEAFATLVKELQTQLYEHDISDDRCVELGELLVRALFKEIRSS